MHIRDANRQDLPAIVAIYNLAIPSRMVTADTQAVSVASRETWFEEHSPDHRPLWVAQENDTVVGWMSFSSFYGRPAYHATCEIAVYLAPDQQRRGLGTALLRHGIDYAPKIAVTTLLGFIFAHNQPSLRLFEKLGFQRWGHLPRVAVLDGIERDLVIVGLRI